MSIPLPLHTATEVLLLGAHADDIEIGCGGLLLNWKQLPTRPRLTWVVFSGDETRKMEAEASFSWYCQGAANDQFLMYDFPDSFFPAHWQQIKQVFHQLSQRASYDVIMTHGPMDQHQDHQMLWQLTQYAFRQTLILGYEIPKSDGDLRRPQLYAPLTRPIAQQKADWIYNAFPSQQNKAWFEQETFLSLSRLRGIESDSSEYYAEGFYANKIGIL